MEKFKSIIEKTPPVLRPAVFLVVGQFEIPTAAFPD